MIDLDIRPCTFIANVLEPSQVLFEVDFVNAYPPNQTSLIVSKVQQCLISVGHGGCRIYLVIDEHNALLLLLECVLVAALRFALEDCIVGIARALSLCELLLDHFHVLV